MLKKAKIRLLTRAAQNRSSVFARVYRAATVRESVPNGLFQQPVRKQCALKRNGLEISVGRFWHRCRLVVVGLYLAQEPTGAALQNVYQRKELLYRNYSSPSTFSISELFQTATLPRP